MEGFTPGWNDPPKNVKSTGNLKINLNKRVAFPLSSSPSSQPSVAPLLLPPKPPTSLPDPANTNPSDSVLCEEISFDDLNLKKEKVLRVLNREVDSLNPSIQSSVASKLKTLDDEWAKSDSELKKLLVDLTEFLEAKDVKSAATMQRKLVMKGTNGQWLHALRQIIMNLEKHEDDAPTSDNQC